MVIPKYKLNGRPVFTISLPGGQLAPLPSSIMPLTMAMIYCIYMQ